MTTLDERKESIDNLCNRAYVALSKGDSFFCFHKNNAEFISFYLSMVFEKPYTWVYDSVYYIIPV